jgi:hypothetical protein
MHRPLLAIGATAAAGFVLLKLLPVLIGLVLTIVKFVAIGGLICLAIWFFTRKKDKGGEAPAS